MESFDFGGADFYIGDIQNEPLTWLGSTSDGGWPTGGWLNSSAGGVWFDILRADSIHSYIDAVNAHLADFPGVRNGSGQNKPATYRCPWVYTYTNGTLVSFKKSLWCRAEKLYVEDVRVAIEKVWSIEGELIGHPGSISLPDPSDELVHFGCTPIEPFADAQQLSISVSCNHSAALALVAILERLKQMSSMGCTREVVIEDFGQISFDGDGSDRITSISVNGLTLKEWRDTYHRNGSFWVREDDLIGAAINEAEQSTCENNSKQP